MDTGWIRIYRQLVDSEIWQFRPFQKGQAWIDLLMLTNWESGIVTVKNGMTININRGECGWSVVKLANRWGWSRGKVDRFLCYLEEQKMIQQKIIANTTIIVICNYEQFQGEAANGQQTDSKQAANGQQTGTIKEEIRIIPTACAPAPAHVRIPVNAAEVVKIAENAGRVMTTVQAEFYLAKRGRENWRMADGRPIHSIPHDITYFLLHWNQVEADKGRSSSSAPRPQPPPISAPVSKFQTKKLN